MGFIKMLDAEGLATPLTVAVVGLPGVISRVTPGCVGIAVFNKVRWAVAAVGRLTIKALTPNKWYTTSPLTAVGVNTEDRAGLLNTEGEEASAAAVAPAVAGSIP